MESRTITVVVSAQQKKYLINTGAETLGELKAELRSKCINCDNISFFEGLTRTELIDDTSLLPRDVNYRGETTNNLVFLLTTKKDKIKSGMSRKELYQALTDEMKEYIKDTFGRNYTILANEDLESVITEFTKPKNTKSKDCEEVTSNCEEPSFGPREITILINSLMRVKENLKTALDSLETVISELDIPENNRSSAPFTDSEIDEMFNFVN